MALRDQKTFDIGAGEQGDLLRRIIDEQCKRFNVQLPELVRIALRTLPQVPDNKVVRYGAAKVKK